MVVEIDPGFGWVLIVLVVNLLLNQYMSFSVGSARRRYKVFYPTMYASESDNKDAKLFNCVQRAHQSTLEYMSTFFVLLLLGGFQYPLVATFFGVVYIVGRILYFTAYSAGPASARYSTGGRLYWVGLLGLLFCVIGLIRRLLFPAHV